MEKDLAGMTLDFVIRKKCLLVKEKWPIWLTANGSSVIVDGTVADRALEPSMTIAAFGWRWYWGVSEEASALA
jgi:hypothetical protein